MARRRTVTAPPQPDDLTRYRSRPTLAGPFGDIEEPTEGPLAVVLARRAADAAAGMAPVIEYKTLGATWAAWRRPLLLADLAREGLAHERSRTIRRKATGELGEETRWEVSAEGWQRLRAAERS